MDGKSRDSDSVLVDGILESLYQADMDVHFAFSLARDEQVADLLGQVVVRIEELIGMVQGRGGAPLDPQPGNVIETS
jgi:hypothetical protein